MAPARSAWFRSRYRIDFLEGCPDGKTDTPAASVRRSRCRTGLRRDCPAGSADNASAEPLQLRFCLLQIEPHVHLAVHRRRLGEMLPCLLTLARAPVELAEAEVAVGDEGAHLEHARESERLLEGLARRRRIGRVSGRGTFPEHPQRLGLVPPFPVASRQHERFLHGPSGVVGPAAARGPDPQGDETRRRALARTGAPLPDWRTAPMPGRRPGAEDVPRVPTARPGMYGVRAP